MSEESQGGAVVDNEAERRFELVERGLTAFADYQLRDDVVIVPHVEAPPALRGTGAAGRLMAGMLDQIRAKGRRIAPLCPYAAAYIRRHPEYADLVS